MVAEPNCLRNRLSNAEAARYIGITPQLLNTWRWLGKSPPYIKAGRKVQYTQYDLDKWLLGQMRTSTSDRPAA